MGDEDDGKEYRWETGYEKTWYNMITFLYLYFYNIQKLVSYETGKLSKKMTMGYSNQMWPNW